MAVETGQQQILEIPYTPRRFWRDEIHPALEKYQRAIIVAHRRFGKTEGCINHIIKMALNNTKYRSPSYVYLAPFLNQAKMIAWERLKYYTATIPGVKVNASELWVELPSYFENAIGARIYVMGADRPDRLRGVHWDGVVIDEFAQIKKEVWGEAIVPALIDHNGWAVFIGTPKGQNQFYDMYLEAQKNDNWYHTLLTVDDTGVLSKKQIEEMKADMTPAEIQQELYCDFSASATNVLIPLTLINAAMDKHEDGVNEIEYKDSPRIIGVDVARFGDDCSVIFRRQGIMAFEPKVYKEIDNMTLASLITKEIDDWNPDAVFIDAGRGEGVIDRLIQLGYKNVIEVPFGGAADLNTRYYNKRTEMWDGCRHWLETGGVLPYLPNLRQELSTPEYSFDANNRMKLQPKKEIKEKTGKSPDIADALCLTFAYSVRAGRSNIYMRAKKLGKLSRYGGL